MAKKIPRGCHCYKIKKVQYTKIGLPVLKIKKCPYYSHQEDSLFGFCSFIDKEIIDYVKDCGVKK